MSAAAWIGGAAASLAFHAVLAAALAVSVAPQPVEPQAPPDSRLVLAAYEVRQSEAVASAPEETEVPPGETESAALSQDAIPRVAALPQVPPSLPTPPRTPPASRLAPALNPDTSALGATAPPADALSQQAGGAFRVSASVVAATMAVAAAPPVETAATAPPPAEGVVAALPYPMVLSDVAPPAASLVAHRTEAPQVEPRRPDSTQLTGLAPDPGPAVAATPPQETRSDPLRPPSAGIAGSAPAAAEAEALPAPSAPAVATPAGALAHDVPSAQPRSEYMTAALAWSGDNQAAVDPVSLAAIQSFMTESDLEGSRLDAGSVRDGIAGLLAQVPCARLQAAFIPETGSLELRGHVPEEGLRAPVLAALRAQVGSSIPVSDNLLILPRPQCGALAGIAALGLPQSTDQETNPLLVGQDAHARLYRYAEGQRMIFDLIAPDYDGFVYVDYFDADGMVVHLVPNEHVTIERRAAKSAVTIGTDRPNGNVLAVTVGPPFGQEIAAAFAASAPLYDGVRPTVEPAAPYLAWLRDRVAAARAAQADFKGEWVYFFVATSPRD